MSRAAVQIRAGAVRGMAAATTERAPGAPDLPPIAETVPGHEVSAWFGLSTPGQTPDAVVQHLSAEIADIPREPEMRRRLAEAGAPHIGRPAAFTAAGAAEVDEWKRIDEPTPVRIE